ncbi:hypothetical protein ACOMHN_014688 [Nucella lapillus]
MTMKDAMEEGKVVIQAMSKKKLSEEKKSYGLLTIRTSRESRPYTIHGVRDPKTNKMLTVEEATQNGVLAPNSTYRTASGESIGLHEAIERGFLDVTFDEEHASSASEVECKTYAVHGVVNQRTKQKVSFSDAVRLGLLNKDTGVYLHNVTQERFPAQEAIMRGFVKARFIKDASKLDIDPRNTIVVQKLESAKKKLMQEIHTLNAFKGMSKHH